MTDSAAIRAPWIELQDGEAEIELIIAYFAYKTADNSERIVGTTAATRTVGTEPWAGRIHEVIRARVRDSAVVRVDPMLRVAASPECREEERHHQDTRLHGEIPGHDPLTHWSHGSRLQIMGRGGGAVPPSGSTGSCAWGTQKFKHWRTSGSEQVRAYGQPGGAWLQLAPMSGSAKASTSMAWLNDRQLLSRAPPPIAGGETQIHDDSPSLCRCPLRVSPQHRSSARLWASQTVRVLWTRRAPSASRRPWAQAGGATIPVMRQAGRTHS